MNAHAVAAATAAATTVIIMCSTTRSVGSTLGNVGRIDRTHTQSVCRLSTCEFGGMKEQ